MALCVTLPDFYIILVLLALKFVLVRVFRPLFTLRFRYCVLCLRFLFKSRREKDNAVEKWFENMAPVGVNPFEAVTTYKTWASESTAAARGKADGFPKGIDDSDFNGHLSNSSYAKVCL